MSIIIFKIYQYTGAKEIQKEQEIRGISIWKKGIKCHWGKSKITHKFKN